MAQLSHVFRILRNPRVAAEGPDALPIDAWEFRIALHMFVRKGETANARYLVSRGVEPLRQTVAYWNRDAERRIHAPPTPDSGTRSAAGLFN